MIILQTVLPLEKSPASCGCETAGKASAHDSLGLLNRKWQFDRISVSRKEGDKVLWVNPIYFTRPTQIGKRAESTVKQNKQIWGPNKMPRS